MTDVPYEIRPTGRVVVGDVSVLRKQPVVERRRRWQAEAPTIPDGLLRLSVGIEDVEDLWDDLREALDGCVG